MPNKYLTIAALLISVAGCNEQTETTEDAATETTEAADDKGATLATVNGLEGGAKEFEAAASRKIPKAGESLSMDEKKEVLDRLVDEKGVEDTLFAPEAYDCAILIALAAEAAHNALQSLGGPP